MSNHSSNPSDKSLMLRPNCKAGEQLFLWSGPNSPPLGIVDHELIKSIRAAVAQASLKDTESYGAGLKKFHVFCDAFSIPEKDRLPASPAVLHSFTLWAAADPSIVPAEHASSLGSIAVSTTKKYLAAIRAWHLIQGWPPPLSPEVSAHINWSLRGLEVIQAGRRSRPPCPPITLQMLSTLETKLDTQQPFDACVWAAATCAFWGLMRFGEVSVRSREAFDGRLHAKRQDASLAWEDDKVSTVKVSLPAAKTAKPGQVQTVSLVPQLTGCPVRALLNLASVVPACPADPLFSWKDRQGCIRPLTKKAALLRINGILMEAGWGSSFGHSFRIGGASLLLAQGASPEMVRLAGRWKSLAYETYIRAFEQVALKQLGFIEQEKPQERSTAGFNGRVVGDHGGSRG